MSEQGGGMGLDFSGSSTAAVNQSTGGNGGIQFAPKGMQPQTMILIGAALVAAWFLFKRKK